MADSINPFEVLGVDETATADEITAAYRARAKVLDPNGMTEARDDDHAAAQAAMIELNYAHQLLTDDTTRKQYRRAQKRRRAAARDVHLFGSREAGLAEVTVDDRTAGTPWVATRRFRRFSRPR